ncbi:MAG: DM13 domain-containing protein [Candidatus Peribacteraceae bacterium]|nr:DM13 domain-containing protein [Candidatus Peribacteraceae bacterium]
MKKILLSLATVAILAVAWVLLSPLFIDTVVDESFPPASEVMKSENASEAMKNEDAMDKEARSSTTSESEPQAMEKTMPDPATEEPKNTEPTAELSGTFQDADDFHRGSGKATVYAQADRKYFLRFEDFTVTNGPDLSVYLVRSADGNVDSGFLDLGRLKGNIGNQNYEIPEGTDLTQYKSVVIWCVAFSVSFSVAALQ